jgi:hypothetical protein
MRDKTPAPEQVTLSSGAKIGRIIAMELALMALYKLAIARGSERRVGYELRNALLMAEIACPELKEVCVAKKNRRERCDL